MTRDASAPDRTPEPVPAAQDSPEVPPWGTPPKCREHDWVETTSWVDYARHYICGRCGQQKRVAR